MVVYFNGEFIDKDQVRISPDDRGFLYADGVYEVIRCYHGKVFKSDEHINRLMYSLDQVKIVCNEVWYFEDIFEDLIRINDLTEDDIIFYIQITRGVAPRKLKFPDSETPPTVYITPAHVDPDLVAYKKGVEAITVEDNRWGRCDIKSVALLPNVLAQQEAIEKGCKMALFVKDGIITEGTHVGVFGVKDGSLITHPNGNAILPSITRGVVMDLCESENIPVVEEAIEANQISELDEVSIVGTTPEITPVITINGYPVGDGEPGKITGKLQNAYQSLIDNL